jgi:hypothetical protein
MSEADKETYLNREAALRRCGICNKGPIFNWARRVGQVCSKCQERAVDSKSQPIFIEQLFQDEAGLLFIQNPKAYLRQGQAEPTFPFTPCDEVNETGSCWVDSIECLIWEGRFGGVGLVVAEVSKLPIESRNLLPKAHSGRANIE